MRISISRHAAEVLVIGVAVLLVTACNSKEEATAQTPVATATNITAAFTATATNTVTVTQAPLIITPADARKHIGESVTVQGRVTDVHVTQKGDVFLNFGGKFPNVVFTAVCFQGAIPAAELTALNGKTISVSGKVKDYNGRVEIVLESADQIGR